MFHLRSDKRLGLCFGDDIVERLRGPLHTKFGVEAKYLTKLKKNWVMFMIRKLLGRGRR